MPMTPQREPAVSPEKLAEDRRWVRTAMILATLSAILAGVFISLSRAVVQGATGDIDRQLLLAMREPGDLGDPIGPHWVEEVGRDFTALGGVAVLTLTIATVVLFFWLASMRRAALYVLASSLGAVALSSALKYAFDRPRPDLVSHGSLIYTSSFPSGHSMLATAVYLTLGLVASRFVPRRRLRALLIGAAIVVAAAVGVSRVYLGVHWPSDVLAGWAVGAAWALVCWCAALWLQDYGMIERDLEHPQEINGVK